MTSGKINFRHYEGSKKDADRVLDEVGMAERREREKREMVQKITYEPQRKPKEHGPER